VGGSACTRIGGRPCGAPGACHAVGQQADGQHVVQVGVGDEDVVDARHLVEREVAHAGAGVDEHVVVDEEGSGSAAGGNRARTTEDADLHGQWEARGARTGRAEMLAKGRCSPRGAMPPDAQGKAPRFAGAVDGARSPGVTPFTRAVPPAASVSGG
jgi:hypothetical protein